MQNSIKKRQNWNSIFKSSRRQNTVIRNGKLMKNSKKSHLNASEGGTEELKDLCLSYTHKMLIEKEREIHRDLSNEALIQCGREKKMLELWGNIKCSRAAFLRIFHLLGGWVLAEWTCWRIYSRTLIKLKLVVNKSILLISFRNRGRPRLLSFHIIIGRLTISAVKL